MGIQILFKIDQEGIHAVEHETEYMSMCECGDDCSPVCPECGREAYAMPQARLEGFGWVRVYDGDTAVVDANPWGLNRAPLLKYLYERDAVFTEQ